MKHLFKKFRNFIIIITLTVLGLYIFSQQARSPEKEVSFSLKTISCPERVYLKVILSADYDLIQKVLLITPGNEIVRLGKGDFQEKPPTGVLVSKRINLDSISPGEYCLKIYYENSLRIKKVYFSPHYIGRPKKFEVKGSIVKLKVADNVLLCVVEVKDKKTNITKRSGYILPMSISQDENYYLDKMNLKPGRKYKIRVKSYDRNLVRFGPRLLPESNENISEFKSFQYLPGLTRLESWRIIDVIYKDFACGQRNFYIFQVLIDNPAKVKKIICYGPRGRIYKLQWVGYRQCYSCRARELTGGVFRLKIYPFEGKPITVEKKFLFGGGHEIIENLRYGNRAITWEDYTDNKIYQVHIYEETKTGKLFRKKITNKVKGNSLLLEEGEFRKNQDYCFGVASFRKVCDGRIVNIYCSAVHCFTFR